MERTPVTSRSIKSIGHDPATNTLEVEFHNGSVYQHADVDALEHGRLRGAESIGRHYNAHIKGKKAHTKLR